jgi:hypothetical protein
LRYEVARELCEAFNDIDHGLSVNVQFVGGNIVVEARKTYHAVTALPKEYLENVSDDEACAKLIEAASKAVDECVRSSKEP